MLTALRKVFYIGLLSCSFFENSNAARGFDVLIHCVDLTIHNHDLVAHAEVTLPMYKKHKAIHFEFEFQKPIEAFKIKLVAHAARQKLPLVDLLVDGCDILRTDVERATLVKVLTKAIYANSKIPKKCPMPANERFVVQNFYLDPENFPTFTPLMNTFANLSILYNKKPLFSFYANVEFKKI